MQTGNRFGEWVQVDLGKTCVCGYQGQHMIRDIRRPDFPRTVMGPVHIALYSPSFIETYTLIFTYYQIRQEIQAILYIKIVLRLTSDSHGNSLEYYCYLGHCVKSRNFIDF